MQPGVERKHKGQRMTVNTSTNCWRNSDRRKQQNVKFGFAFPFCIGLSIPRLGVSLFPLMPQDAEIAVQGLLTHWYPIFISIDDVIIPAVKATLF